MDPVARYNRLKEAEDQLLKVQKNLADINVCLQRLDQAVAEVAIELNAAYKATLPKMKGSKL